MGADAFSRTRDPATGDFGDAKVIKKFGDVPDNFEPFHNLHINTQAPRHEQT